MAERKGEQKKTNNTNEGKTKKEKDKAYRT
jgi:hypothetical protein